MSLSQIEILVLEGVSLTLMSDIYLIQSQKGRLYALQRGEAEEILVLNQTWLPAQRKSQQGCEEFHSSLPPWFSPSLPETPNLALLHVLRYLSLSLFFPSFHRSAICSQSRLTCISTPSHLFTHLIDPTSKPTADLGHSTFQKQCFKHLLAYSV